MFFNYQEIIDMVVMTLVLGFIFKDMFPNRQKAYEDPLHYYASKRNSDMENFKFAVMLTVPAVLFHEFGHKFVAMSFGLQATFGTSYAWLLIALIMKAMNFGMIFIVPAFVSIQPGPIMIANPYIGSIISFAGPAVNLLLWGMSKFLIGQKKVPRKYLQFAYLTKSINGFLFVFNMLPIPPFDGFQVVMGIVRSLGF
jgi:Zn-dependent protease